jgi:hypothetical protein
MRETGRWRCTWMIDKFSALADDPHEHLVREGNVLTSAGVGYLWNRMCGGGLMGSATMGAAYVRMGIGDGVTAATDADSDLSGTNQWFQPCRTDDPEISGPHQRIFVASFDPGVASFDWNEAGMTLDFAGSGVGDSVIGSGNLLFNHRADLGGGTKPADELWTLTAVLGIY